MLLVFALAVPVLTLAQQQSKAEKEVLAVVEEIRQAYFKGGSEILAILDKYIADDYVRISGRGELNSKADIQNGWKSGALKIESFEFSDLKAHTYGKTVVIVEGIETGKGTYLGRPWAGANRFSRVFVKQGGIWKNVQYQDTPIPAKQ